MEELLYLATPTKDYSTLFLLLVLLSGLMAFLVWVQFKQPKQITGNYRQISLLLGGLVALILLSTTLFTAWNLYTIQDVRLYPTYMETFHGKTTYKEIKRAGIYNDQQKSFVNPQLTIRNDDILIVEKKDKVMLFADEHYDIQTLVRKIREKMEED